MDKWFAHRREDGALQTVSDHLHGTAERAGQFSSSFDAYEQGVLVGISHDIGKYATEFQRRLLDNGPRVDHATAGAWECVKAGQGYAAFCTIGHHSGLPDQGTKDDYEEASLYGRLNRAHAGAIPNYEAWETQISLPHAVFPPYIGKDALTDSFFVRMLYSCLVDADYLDTEAFMQPEQKRGDDASIEDLEKRLDNVLKSQFPAQNTLNEKRCAIRQSCIDAAVQPQGLFTLTVPTGGGKTVASLAFALKHARIHGLNRVIYVVPYTSIIEQTAQAFREMLGSKHVLEHHSGVNFDTEDDQLEANRFALSAENWDMPVIVTTAVQFFESLFANRSSRCRKLHNIAKSVVIFDEAQMIPTPYLRPCIFAISELVRHYHVSAVLCTATQPALESIFHEFIPGMKSVEMCPQALSGDPIFQRTKIEQTGVLPWEEVAERMNKKNQILCIVNSRKNAQTVYRALRGEGCFHLSTLMVPAHRKAVLDMIRQRLKEGLCCRVVSTSLIEAGVDVDFPYVLREESGLDSVIQAAGRCNREGRNAAEKSIVTVFRPETKPPVLFSMQISAARAALRRFEDAASSEAVHAYFEELFLLKGQEALDQNGVIRQFKSGTFPFKTVAEQFHLIDEGTISVFVPIGEGAEYLASLKAGKIGRELMRRISRYSVNLYPEHFRNLQQAGAIEPYNETIWVLQDLTLYSSETGLSIEVDSGNAEFV